MGQEFKRHGKCMRAPADDTEFPALNSRLGIDQRVFFGVVVLFSVLDVVNVQFCPAGVAYDEDFKIVNGQRRLYVYAVQTVVLFGKRRPTIHPLLVQLNLEGLDSPERNHGSTGALGVAAVIVSLDYVWGGTQSSQS